MLRVLLKKQLSEMFAFCYQNKKTGQRNPLPRVLLLGAVLLVCYASLAMAFVGMSEMFADALFGSGQQWLYMSVAGLAALCFGTFGSIFATYNTLYKAKDNDLLLSMPVPAGAILFSRMLSVYLIGLLFVALSWLPAIIVYALKLHPGAGIVVADAAMTFLIAAAVTAIGCLLGWVVALIASKLRRRNVATALLAVLGIGLYYLFCFRMNDVLQSILKNISALRDIIETKLYPIYQLGLGAAGNAVSYLIFAVIAIGAVGICYLILAKTFFSIITTQRGEKKRVYREGKERASGVSAALLRKEFSRWTGSTVYLLNTGLGLLIMVAAAVMLVIKRQDIAGLFVLADAAGPWLRGLLPVFATLLACMISSMNMVTAPSVSLEGKQLWILRSAPVSSRDILNAKQRLHILVCLFPTLLLSGAIIYLFRPGIIVSVLTVLIPLCSVTLFSAAGLALNLKMPNLIWTNESVPVKSSAPVAITMFGGWVLVLLLGVLCYLARTALAPELQMLAILAVMAAGTLLINRWIRVRGTMLFDEL